MTAPRPETSEPLRQHQCLRREPWDQTARAVGACGFPCGNKGIHCMLEKRYFERV
jgi:hypothetical protein